MNLRTQTLELLTPDMPDAELFTDPEKAVSRLCEMYEDAIVFLKDQFMSAMTNGHPGKRIRAYYPEIRISVATYAKMDSRLSFGHVAIRAISRPLSPAQRCSGPI